jgi:hypothetical protein
MFQEPSVQEHIDRIEQALKDVQVELAGMRADLAAWRAETPDHLIERILDVLEKLE